MLKIFHQKCMKIICAFFLIMLIFVIIVVERRIDIKTEQSKAYSIDTITDVEIASALDENTVNLMIVAHPDDEVLWGGGHLMSRDYLVVCVTNGNHSTRSEEFRNVVEKSGNKYLMLGYPDKVGGRRDNWLSVEDKILLDIKKIMEYKDWNLIVTHNQNGEYGHIHHQNVHSYVTQIYDSEKIDSKLFCFGKYYTAKGIEDVQQKLMPISDEEYNFKKNLSEIYSSQENTIDKLWHMAKYEEWTQYEKFSEHLQYK